MFILSILFFLKATYLSTFVSKDRELEQKSAVKVMVELMGNCIARNFNFKGNKGKSSFEDSALWTVVKGTCCDFLKVLSV